MYAESDFVALSALQHYVFCPRQCALIHLEQVWSENLYTAEGRAMHERADSAVTSYREGVRVTRSVPLRSSALGVSGVADVVEWHRQKNEFQPFPVEYKRGKPKKHDADKVQLCAQAMCLEEMRSCTILSGALFYGQTMHRLDVVFDEAMRSKTVAAAAGVHELFASCVTPHPEFGPKCKLCSLFDECMPEVLERHGSAKWYVQKLYRELSGEAI